MLPKCGCLALMPVYSYHIESKRRSTSRSELTEAAMKRPAVLAFVAGVALGMALVASLAMDYELSIRNVAPAWRPWRTNERQCGAGGRGAAAAGGAGGENGHLRGLD